MTLHFSFIIHKYSELSAGVDRRIGFQPVGYGPPKEIGRGSPDDLKGDDVWLLVDLTRTGRMPILRL